MIVVQTSESLEAGPPDAICTLIIALNSVQQHKRIVSYKSHRVNQPYSQNGSCVP